MRVQLFGSIRAVEAGGHEISLGGPKQRTVLAMLCVDPGRAVSTDRLISAVWGDSVPERAARSLSTYLSSLRRGMGDAIESDRGSHTLHVDRSQVDVCAFIDAVDASSNVDGYRKALALWRGAPFEDLDGFGAFRDEIQHLDEHRLVAERAVIEADLASGGAVAVVPRIDALVLRFPFDEGLRGIHMRALYGAGRQVEALESFNSFKAQLAGELGLDPSPALQDLELQILQQDEALVGTRQEASSVSREERTRVPFPGFLTSGHSSELIGRQEPLAQLDFAYASALDGTRIVAVVGEPGIGKTALTSTWAAHNVDHGAMVVAGRCTPDAALSYQPFIEIAKAVLAAEPYRIRDVGPAAGNLALLVPGVGDAKDLPAPIQADPDTVEYLMAEAFAALLKPMPGDPATIMILEDLHWADPQSIAVLAHLARRTDDMPLLIIANYRDTDLVRSHPLPSLLVDLRRERQLDRLLLGRLRDDQVGEMISAHFGFNASEAVAASITEKTRGNPFFVEELTRHLQEEHAIDDRGVWASAVPIAEYGIPEGLRDVIGQRVYQLGPPATALLEAAAVIGPSFSIDMAGAIVGLDEDQIDSIADSTSAASIISEDTETGEYAFAHALVRQALYDELSARRRVRLHRAVGEATEQSNGDPAIALHHWLAANQPDRALAAAIRASTEGHSIAASLRARQYVDLALDLWDDVDDPESVSGMTHAELVLLMSSSIAYPNAERQADLDLVRSELEASNGLDNVTLGRLHSELAMVLWMPGVADEIMHHSFIAMELVPSDPPSIDRAAVAANHSAHLMVAGRANEALATGLEALEMARDVGSVYAEAYALNAVSSSLGQLGRVNEADRYFDEHRSLAERSGYVRSHMVVYGNQGEMHRIGGDLEKALQLADEGADFATQIGVDRGASNLEVNGAHVAFDLGRWDEAVRRIESVTPTDTMDSTEMNRISVALVIAAERGTSDVVLDAHRRLDDLNLSLDHPWITANAWSAFLSDWRWHGEYSDAITLSSTALGVHKEIEAWTETVWLAAQSIELAADAIAAGDDNNAWLELARSWHDLLFKKNPATRVTAPLQATSTADLARANGENSPALWRDAVEPWDDGSYGQAKARWRLAEALIETDPDNPDIESNLDLAQDVAQGLGAQPLLSAIEATRDHSAPDPATSDQPYDNTH
jgi:DNA-binding SARP family transcriptional activator/tetratricopeptide (TPR) repeat protein